MLTGWEWGSRVAGMDIFKWVGIAVLALCGFSFGLFAVWVVVVEIAGRKKEGEG